MDCKTVRRDNELLRAALRGLEPRPLRRLLTYLATPAKV